MIISTSNITSQNAREIRATAQRDTAVSAYEYEFQASAKSNSAEFRASMRHDFVEFQTSMREDAAKFQAGMHHDLAEFQTNIREDAAKFQASLCHELAEFRIHFYRLLIKGSLGIFGAVMTSYAPLAYYVFQHMPK
jgi:hypothetical protein